VEEKQFGKGKARYKAEKRIFQENTIVQVTRPRQPVAHAVLLYKTENGKFYLKNTNPDEGDIIIPVNRPTRWQLNIWQKHKDYRFTTKVQVENEFEKLCGFPLNWSFGENDWILDDKGSFLSFGKRK